MAYRIEFNAHAARSFRKLSPDAKRRLAPVIERLKVNPRPSGCVTLSAASDVFRVRAGDYRILYEIHEHALLVLVIEIGHRREFYR